METSKHFFIRRFANDSPAFTPPLLRRRREFFLKIPIHSLYMTCNDLSACHLCACVRAGECFTTMDKNLSLQQGPFWHYLSLLLVDSTTHGLMVYSGTLVGEMLAGVANSKIFPCFDERIRLTQRSFMQQRTS